MKFFYSVIFVVLATTSLCSQTKEELSQLAFDAIRDSISKYSTNNLEKANNAANAYILKGKREKDLEREWLGMEALAINFYKNRMFEKSNVQMEKCLSFAQENDLPEQEMRSITLLGDLQLAVSDVSSQLIYYEKLLALAEQNKDQAFIQLALGRIASVLDLSGDKKKAIEIRKKSIKFYRNKKIDSVFSQKKINSSLASTYATLAHSYIELKKLDSAKIYAAYLRKFSEKDLDSCLIGISYGADAEIAYEEHRFKEAKRLYEKAFGICDYDYDLIKLNKAYSLGKIDLAAGNYDEAIKTLQKGLDDYQVTAVEEGFMEDYYGKLAEAYKYNGNFEKASFYFEKYLNTKEKKNSLKDSAKKQFLDNERESFKAEFNLLKNEKEEKETYLNYLFLGASIIILILLFAILQFYRTKRKNDAKFDALLTKIEAANSPEEIIDTKDEDLEEKNTTDVSPEITRQILNGLKNLEKQEYYLKQECNSYNVAKKIGTNTTYLSKVINGHYGKNFNTYINDLRINYAIVRLKNDVIFRSYSIQSIAEEVGYKSADSFTKYFKKDTGLNPSFYIKEIKNVA